MDFRVLGLTIEARTGEGSPLLDLGGVKQQRVLAALLLAKGNVVSNDRLIDAVWGDRPPAKPNVTLRSYVSHLRRVLEPDRDAGERARRIVTRAPGYAIVVEPHELDAWQFEVEIAAAKAALAAGDHVAALASAERALDRWSVDDAQGGVLEPFDVEVSGLEDLRRLGRRVAHESLLALGRHDEALPSLEAALRHDRFDEGVRAQLMVALYRPAARPTPSHVSPRAVPCCSKSSDSTRRLTCANSSTASCATTRIWIGGRSSFRSEGPTGRRRPGKPSRVARVHLAASTLPLRPAGNAKSTSWSRSWIRRWLAGAVAW
ncbi:MAG: BTAD domain-containing putative transcriptional regulator [Acidimicrobiales bacterium]